LLVEERGGQLTRPLSTGESKASTRLETPPVEVMITTMTICGCSGRTSMWRIVAVCSGGADTDRQEVRDLRQRLGREAHRLVDLAAGQRELDRAAARTLGQQRSTKLAVSPSRRDATRRGVRMREEAVLLEHRELVATVGRAGLQLGVGGDRPRRHGLHRRLVGEDDLAQDELLARG